MKRKRSSSPETTSTSTSGALYDVFLSFRGPDTRATFTDTLYYALKDKGIHVFIDKKGIEEGQEIGPEIFQAIDDSKICIPIFSKGYASSSWCLRELEHMMKRRKTSDLEVMPIFFDVEPDDVKLATGVYRDALTQHKEERDPKTVQGWEEALKGVTKIKGWDTKDTGHGELTRLIARKVLVELKVSCVHIPDYLVGMDKPVKEVTDLLNVESKDVRLIGIWGMGGVGKTTLAKVVYDRLSNYFDSCSFISNIREASQGCSLLNLQRQFVYDIIGDMGFQLCSIDHGKNMIKNRFCRVKVLIFLDDIDHERQLFALAEKQEWFCPGSRIVVTTRDKSVLSGFQGRFEHCLIYEAKGLNKVEALQLFSKHAFRSNSPPNALLNLSKEVVAKTGGLPLAIEVMGSLLYGQKEAIWKATLKKMALCPHEDVKKNLMLSYEALDHLQQQIFLDIACFLTDDLKSYSVYMWEDSGFFPDEGIEVLQSRSLVKIDEEDYIEMHDQLQDLGESIVYEKYREDPTKGSRVWRQKDLAHNIHQKKGTETVAAFYEDSVLTPQDFTEMPNIRYLEMTSSSLSGDFQGLFSELRWLFWPWCPNDFQTTNFCPKNLVILELSNSRIDEHWGGWNQLKVATRLKVLDLSYCRELKETPDLSAFLSLEILLLEFCENLLRIDCSIGHLKCLKCLNLIGCHQLQVLPVELGSLEALTELLIHDHGRLMSIREVPSSIEALINLERLIICGAINLTRLPDSIGMLKSLVELDISKTGIAKLPDTMANLSSLKVLKINESHIQQLPEGIGMLEALTEPLIDNNGFPESISEVPNSIEAVVSRKRLVIFGAINLTRLPDAIGLLKDLVELDISKTGIVELPDVIANLKCLKVLKIRESNMQKLPERIGMLEALTELLICNYGFPGSISEVPNSIEGLVNLKRLVICGAVKLTRLPDSIRMLKGLVELDVSATGIIELPNPIVNLKSLKVLKMNGSRMQKLPEGIGMLEDLTDLLIDNHDVLGGITEVPSSIGALENLKRLVLRGAIKLTTLPDSIGMLKSLDELDVSKTGIAELPNTIANLESLKVLKMNGSRMQKLPEGIGMLKGLDELDVSETSIAELPSAIGKLNSLRVLKMNKSHMQKLPEAIGMLVKLEEIYGEGCTQLKMIPDDIVRLPLLKIMILTGTRLQNVPKLPQTLASLCLSSYATEKAPEISNLVKLRHLELHFTCSRYIPSDTTYSNCCMLVLISITTVSSYLGCFQYLQELQLINCSNLHQIEQLPSGLRKLIVWDCDLLEVVDLFNLSEFKNLEHLSIECCPKLGEIRGLDRLESLKCLFINYCGSLLRLPDLSIWKKLKMWNVDALTTCSAKGKQVARSFDLPL